jgi:hypothetical protein
LKCYNFPASVTALAYAIAEKCNDEEIALIITLLSQLRDTLTSIIVCRAFGNDKNEKIVFEKKSEKDEKKNNILFLVY